MAKQDWQKKAAEWLQGRNGSDELGICVSLVALILVIVNIFLNSFIISVIALVLIVYTFWRSASRNLEARENENGVFCEFLGPVRPWVRNPVEAFSEARAYRHFKCPECGQRVRVPRGKGKVRVRCPKCSTKFDARS